VAERRARVVRVGRGPEVSEEVTNRPGCTLTTA